MRKTTRNWTPGAAQEEEHMKREGWGMAGVSCLHVTAPTFCSYSLQSGHCCTAAVAASLPRLGESASSDRSDSGDKSESSEGGDSGNY